MVSSRIHNIADYVIASFLLFAPTFFDFENVPPARNAFILIGTAVLVYSLLTDYKLALIDGIPAAAHGFLDVFAGLFLAFSPWLFDYSNELTPQLLQLHLASGAGLVVLAAVTHYREAAVNVRQKFKIQPRQRLQPRH